MKREKLRLRRIFFGGVLLALTLFLKYGMPAAAPLVLFAAGLCAVLVSGGDVMLRAGKNILRGKVFGEHFLMSVAALGALCIGEGAEGAAVMLFYQVGGYFQDKSVSRSRDSIRRLMDIRPDCANVVREGETRTVPSEEVASGETILIRPGERIPLDAVILEGVSLVDTSALTGESIPREVSAGDAVLSGCINQTGLLKAETRSGYQDSTASKILHLVENAAERKSKTEEFITRFARWYTPAVTGAALLLALLPPLVFGGTVQEWLYRALTFLVISCPCALVISIPMSYFGGIGGASKSGILIKGGNFLEALARARVVVFDKTGTLTKGVFRVGEFNPVGISREELLRVAAHAESHSTHPIAQALERAYQGELRREALEEVSETAGFGVSARFEGREVLVGNRKWMEQYQIPAEDPPKGGTVVHVAIAGAYAGNLVISDEIKEDARDAVSRLRKQGIRKMVMLTGDREHAAGAVARELALDQYHAELLPADKLERLEAIMAGAKKGETVIFVGDGINDAPVLVRSDIGIAMGGLGSDAAVEASDIVIMDDAPSKVAAAIEFSKRTRAIARQNIIFSLGTKGVILLLGMFGMAAMWAAVFADVGVALLAIGNASRMLQKRE